jgi:hypothetical protein
MEIEKGGNMLCDAHEQFVTSFQRVQDSVAGLYDLDREATKRANDRAEEGNAQIMTLAGNVERLADAVERNELGVEAMRTAFDAKLDKIIAAQSRPQKTRMSGRSIAAIITAILGSGGLGAITMLMTKGVVK